MSRRFRLNFATIRNLHFLCAACMAAFTFFYGFSGIVMGYEQYLPKSEQKIQESFELQAPAPHRLTKPEGRRWADEVGQELGVTGKLASAGLGKNGNWKLEFRRPGTKSQLTIPSGATTGNLDRTTYGPVFTLNRFHQLKGFGGPPAMSIWAIAVDLVSVAMLFFAGSGIYLWWKSKRDALGTVLLGSGTIYVIGTIVYFV